MAQNDEWLRPLPRRVVVFAICLGMLIAEIFLLGAEQLWLFLFGALTLYAGYDFFLSGKYRGDGPST